MNLSQYDRVCLRRVLSLLDPEQDAATVKRLRALLGRRDKDFIPIEANRTGGGAAPTGAEFRTRFCDPEPEPTRRLVRAYHQNPPQRRQGGATLPRPNFVTDGHGGIPETGCPVWQGHGFEPPSIPTD